MGKIQSVEKDDEEADDVPDLTVDKHKATPRSTNGRSGRGTPVVTPRGIRKMTHPKSGLKAVGK